MLAKLDAIELTRDAAKVVLQGSRRRYYRFRRDRWYGGIVTADVVGCNLRCVFCWSRSRDPHSPGRLYSPEEVAERLWLLASRHGVKQARFSGGEPTIGWEAHGLKAARIIVRDYGLHLVLETNGVLIGLDRSIARSIADLASQGSIEVRVSIKGATPETFERITLVDSKYWWAQINALRSLVEEGLKPGDEVYPAIMLSFNNEDEVRGLLKLLRDIHPALAENIDPEYVIMYPHVRDRLRRARIWPKRYFNPGEPLPDWMI